MTTEVWAVVAAVAAIASTAAALIALAYTLHQPRYVQDLRRREILVEFMHTTYDINSSELDRILNQIEYLWGHETAGRVHALRDVIGIVRKNHANPRLGDLIRCINYGVLDKLRWQLCNQMRGSLLPSSRKLKLQVTEFPRVLPGLKKLRL